MAHSGFAVDWDLSPAWYACLHWEAQARSRADVVPVSQIDSPRLYQQRHSSHFSTWQDVNKVSTDPARHHGFEEPKYQQLPKRSAQKPSNSNCRYGGKDALQLLWKLARQPYLRPSNSVTDAQRPLQVADELDPQHLPVRQDPRVVSSVEKDHPVNPFRVDFREAKATSH
jgi:hypothetical protein